MLFGETVAVYCENHTEHTDTLCGQNSEFYYVKVCGTYSYRCALRDCRKTFVLSKRGKKKDKQSKWRPAPYLDLLPEEGNVQDSETLRLGKNKCP
jgi:hypothetical protein